MFKLDKQDLQTIESAMEKGEHALVLEIIADYETKLDKPGAYMLWIKGVCQDMTGEPFLALATFKEGLVADPTKYNLWVSLDITLENIRAHLKRMENDKDVEVDFFRTTQRELLKLGLMNSGIQLRLLKNYFIREAFEEFDGLLENALDLNPNSSELLELKTLRLSTGPLALAN
jgi:tetratricopeptide (TPR) repeat protein